MIWCQQALMLLNILMTFCGHHVMGKTAYRVGGRREAPRGTEHLALHWLHLEMPVCSFSSGEKKELPPPERPEPPQAEEREIRNAEENAESKREGKPFPCPACFADCVCACVYTHTHTPPANCHGSAEEGTQASRLCCKARSPCFDVILEHVI